jgi:hypothetical protein
VRPIAAIMLAFALLAAPGAAAAPVDVSVATGTSAGEPEVEVSPRDPNTIVVGKNDTGVAVSHDRGRTFTQISLPNPGDHVLTVAPDGTFFYSALDGDVRMSADGGDHWATVGNWVGEVAAQSAAVQPVPGGQVAVREAGCSAPEPAGPTEEPGGPGVHKIGCDRPWLDADRTTGTLYVSFVDHDDNSGGQGPPAWELSSVACHSSVIYSPAFECGRQYVSASHDAGRTWSAFRPFDSADYPAGSTGGFSSGPVAAGGVLATAYIASATPAAAAKCPCLVFETSRDDGATFTRHVAATGVPIPASGVQDTASGNVLGGEQSELFEPYTAADPAYPGHYAVMVEDRDMSRLLVWTTRDGGASWEGPAPLSDPFGTQRHLPWLAIGPTGALGAVWRSTAADGSYTAWAAVAPHGDTAFAPPVRISSAVSPGPVQQLAGDDASDVTLDATDLHVAWGDRRGGSLGLRYGRYAFGADPVVETIAKAPLVRVCASRRRFGIRLARGLRSAVVTVDGGPVRVRRRAGRLTAVVDLRGAPRGVARVFIRGRTRRGRLFVSRRAYHPCTRRAHSR